MREIKFRVWDEKKKVMLSQIGSWYFNDEYDEVAFHMNRVTFSDHKYLKLMQYTGLKDRNGKEIYEGDIIRSYNEYGDIFATLSVVKWNEQQARFEGIDTDLLHLEEVIGNIYQDSHLLKAED
jgi:uncharacterized phage protein (TIGR01671 family)